MGKTMYFCGSIRGGRQDIELYAKIIGEMKNYGKVLTEHVGDKNISECSRKTEKEVHDLSIEWLSKSDGEASLSSKEIHDRDMEWLSQADVVVAEVTQPSLGVGYEIGRAVCLNKPILCLFRPDTGKSLSCMIGGLDDESNVTVKNYSGTDDEIKGILKEFLA